MSVLLIGQRSPYYSPQIHPQYLTTPYDRRARQQHYRLELLQQIQENRDRKERQREEEKREEMRYQVYLKQASRPTIFSTPAKDMNHSFIHFASKIPRTTTEPKQAQRQEPTQLKQRRRIFTPSTIDFPSLSANHYGAPLRTQPDHSPSPFQEFVQSYEKRSQELRQYQDKRFEQVYEKMYNSVDSLSNSEEEYQIIRSRIKPIDVRPSRSSTRPIPSPNPEDTNDKLYRLPPIIKASRSRKRTEQGKPQESAKWREQYAREKLRQLEEYYRRALIDDQTRERQQNDDGRAATPAFPKRRP